MKSGKNLYLCTILATIIILALMISCSSGAVESEDSQSGGGSLLETGWQLLEINGNPLIEGTSINLRFTGEIVSGSSGCNSYQGIYSIDDQSLIFGDNLCSLVACSEPEGIQEQENEYLNLLSTVDSYTVADNILTLYSENTPILVFNIIPEE